MYSDDLPQSALCVRYVFILARETRNARDTPPGATVTCSVLTFRAARFQRG